MKYSAQLEREAERNRAEVEETLDELRSRLRPGQLVDQLVDYARDGAGAEFYGNLKRQIAENPLPVTMIGAGLAWLAISANAAYPRRARGGAVDYGSTRERAYGTVRDAERRAAALGDRVSETMESASQGVSDMAGSAAESTRRGAARLRDSASAASATVSERMSSAYAGAADAASRAAHSVSSAGHGLADRGRSFAEFCREQPLVLAGIGVALGAALGAVLPSTETEDRLMGDAADEAKERMQGLANEGAETAQAVAADTANKALGAIEDNQTGGHEDRTGPNVENALGDDSLNTEWPTRDGSGRAADSGGTQSATSGDDVDIEWPTRDGSGRAADSAHRSSG